MNWDDLTKPETAGTLGAILGALNAPGKSIREQAYNLFAGIGCAVYIAPYIAEAFNVGSPHAKMALAFVCGLVGMNVVAKLISSASQFDWLSLFTKRPQ